MATKTRSRPRAAEPAPDAPAEWTTLVVNGPSRPEIRKAKQKYRHMLTPLWTCADRSCPSQAVERGLLNALSGVNAAAQVHRDLRELEARKQRAAEDPGSEIPGIEMEIWDPNSIFVTRPPYNIPDKEVASLVDMMRRGSEECLRALTCVTQGGANLLDDAMTPGTSARSIECHRVLKRGKMLFDRLAITIRFGPLSHQRERKELAALERWSRDTADEFGAALDLRGSGSTGSDVAREVKEVKEPPSEVPPPLTPNAKAVYDLLASLPEGAAMTGDEIIQKLRSGRPAINIGQSTLTSSIIPQLKKHYRVRNRRGAGYYIDRSDD